MRWLNQLAGWAAAMIVVACRWTMRVSIENDPRPEIRAAGKGFAVAFLHAHQVAGVVGFDDKNLMAMVSRSRDGDLLVPSLICCGFRYARGSSRKRGKDKGGQTALAEMQAFVATGGSAMLAVDGPQGPRNVVRRGVVTLAIAEDVPIVPVLMLPSRRWFIQATWDRMQIPKPFSRITLYWGDPIWPEDRTNSELRHVTADALRELEMRFDPEEASRFHDG